MGIALLGLLTSCGTTYTYNCTCKDSSKCGSGKSAGFNSDKAAIEKTVQEKEAEGYTCKID
jgi:hypothetical protein